MLILHETMRARNMKNIKKIGTTRKSKPTRMNA